MGPSQQSEQDAMAWIESGMSRDGLKIDLRSHEVPGRGPALAANPMSGASQIAERPEDAPAKGTGIHAQLAAGRRIAPGAAGSGTVFNSGGRSAAPGSGSDQQSALEDNGGLVRMARGSSGTVLPGPYRMTPSRLLACAAVAAGLALVAGSSLAPSMPADAAAGGPARNADATGSSATRP